MKKRLYSIMADIEEITKQLADMKNVLEIQRDSQCEENQIERLNSLLNVQIRLIKCTRQASCELYKKIDDTILDVVHKRIEI
ncbi:hypothetical protein ACTNB0_08710 [Lachnospiraceae bacterium HCP28S3_F9]